MDDHGTRLQHHRLALARQVIGPLAIHLHGGEGGRDLHDLADEGRQGRLDRRHGRTDIELAGHRAFAVEGGGRAAPGDGETVGLVGVHHEGDGLGGLAQSDGQDAGGKGIEGAGVARLLGVEQSARTRLTAVVDPKS